MADRDKQSIERLEKLDEWVHPQEFAEFFKTALRKDSGKHYCDGVTGSYCYRALDGEKG